MMVNNRRRGMHKYSTSQLVMVDALPWAGGEISWLAGASPAAANGEWMATPYTTLPDGFSYTLSSTGVPTIFSGGSVARQNVNFDLYVPATRSWYGRVVEYINNQPPIVNYTGSITLVFTRTVPVSYNLNLFVVDPEGDGYGISTSDPLPTGLSIVGGVLQGTPTVDQALDVVFNAVDSLGESSPFPSINIAITDVTVPSVIGNDVVVATNTVHALGLTNSVLLQEQPFPPPAGTVLAQDPPAGTGVLPGTNVVLTVSVLPTPPPPVSDAMLVGRTIFEPVLSGEQDMVTFDFLSNLASGETITTAAVVATVYSGVDPSPSSIIIGSATINGSRVNQIVEGGVTGVIYELVCTITTSLSQTLKIAAAYAVQTDLP